MIPILLALLPQAATPTPSASTGTEWMVVASVLVPAVLIAVIIYMGSRKTV